MPYEIRNGNEVWHEKQGKWSLKQRCKNSIEAKKALRLLYGIEGNPEFAAKVHAGQKGKK